MTRKAWKPDGDPRTARSVVVQAIGSASMCWKPPPSTEVFDVARAIWVADGLMLALGINADDPWPSP